MNINIQARNVRILVGSGTDHVSIITDDHKFRTIENIAQVLNEAIALLQSLQLGVAEAPPPDEHG